MMRETASAASKFRGDHEINVEEVVAPDLEILLVGDAGDRLGVRGQSAREQTGDQVRLVARGAGDE